MLGVAAVPLIEAHDVHAARERLVGHPLHVMGLARPVQAVQRVLGQFENLFKNLGDVKDGFPKQIPLNELANRTEYDPQMLSKNLMFGTPDEVIAKLKSYQALGVDEFIYYASMGLGLKEQKRSLELFIKEVMPAFA